RTFNTRWVITVVTALVVVVNLLSPAWRRGEVIRGEVELHYGVLPAIFYEGSLCSVARAGDDETSRDNVSVGTAISQLPFFALAHVAAKATGAPADGYSAPYQLMVLFSSLVYFVIGLIFLSKL